MEALRENEEKYRSLIETTNTGYVIIDPEGKVLDANPEYVRLTGHNEMEEILGRSALTGLPSGTGQETLQQLRNVS